MSENPLALTTEARPSVLAPQDTPQNSGCPIDHSARQQQADAVHRSFNISIVISGLRCLFTYLIAPVILPATGAVVVPGLGVALSLLAIVVDVRALRRFWSIDYPHRRAMTLLYAVLLAFVATMLGIDLARLAS